MNHLLKTNTLYILSGVSGSGKSYLTNQLLNKKIITQDCIINPDTIRLNLLGETPKLDNSGVYQHLNGWIIGNKEAFSIALLALELRMKNQMLTFFDSTALNDKARKDLVFLAKKYGVEAQVIIFDIETDWAIENLKNRTHRFDASVVEGQMSKFERKSIYPYFLYNPLIDTVKVTPNLIETEKLDIIGDTHGLKKDTIELLNKFGWTVDMQNDLRHSDKSRKILFLGDVIDRGLEGDEILDIVEKAVSSKKAYFILGNHEKKLIKMLDDYYNGQTVEKRSISVTLFFKKFLKLSDKKQKRLYKFLKETPVNYSLWIDKKTSLALRKEDILNNDLKENEIIKFGFAHGDISSYNDYVNIPGDLIFGSSTSSISNDYQYEELSKLGINSHIYIHGHQPVKNKEKEVDPNVKYDSVYSLDDRCAYAGNIRMMNFEKLVHLLRQNAYQKKYNLYEQCTINQKISFNFNDYLKEINVEESIDLSEINKGKEKVENVKSFKK